MLLSDRASVTSRRIDARGVLQIEAKVARVGLQRYSYAELGMTRDGFANVYRAPEVVFADAALRSFRGVGLVEGHPPGGDTAKTWRSLAIGHVIDARRDPDNIHVAATCLITSPKAVASLTAQRAGISVGYSCDLLPAAPLPSGETADFQQANIVVDHVAVIPFGTARCGLTCTFADSGAATLADACSCGCNSKGKTVDTIQIGDQQVEADPRIIAEVARLRTEAALRDSRAAMPDSYRLRQDAREAILADQARRNDPSTARGQYIAWLEGAHRANNG